jgi:hypothetical protein
MQGDAAASRPRRSLIRFALLATLLFWTASIGSASPVRAPTNDAAVEAAILYGYPVYQIALARDRAMASAQHDGVVHINRLRHRDRLATAEDRRVTTPNNDTLYSAAWIDLSAGPVTITWPATDRYHSIALLSPFTDNFAVMGSRDGGRGGRVLLVEPDWRGRVPAGHRLIRAPSLDAWCIVRVLVRGADDLPAARRVQQDITVMPAAGAPAIEQRSQGLGDHPDPAVFLDVVNHMLGRSRLTGERAATAARPRSAGIAPGQRGSFGKLPSEIQAAWRRLLPQLTASLKDGFGETGVLRGGWSYPRPGMGRFGADDLYRARVALGGLAALPDDEAVYLTGVADAEGRPLSGDQVYRLRIPAGVPITSGGFWSLSMYELLPDGRQFFTPNPLGRYALGDRTPGLVRNADGSIDVTLSHRQPSDPANWLPAPAGPFRVSFRLYRPLPGVATGGWRIDPLRRVAQ